ncbi:MAG: hypothetical protein ACK5JT_13675 [Hyphomicrobiaceae bacterium]
MTAELRSLISHMSLSADSVIEATIKTEDGSEWHVTWERGQTLVTRTQHFTNP